VQRFIFRHLLGNPERLTALMRLLGTSKRSGLSRLFSRLGLLRWINATLEGAEGLVETVPRRFLRDRLTDLGFVSRKDDGVQQEVLAPSPDAPAPGPRVAYFVGCGTNFQTPRAAEAALLLLAQAGCEVIVPSHVCCGLPAHSYGDREAARELAQRNLEALAAVEADYLVTECGSCSAFLSGYPELLAETPEEDAAVNLAARLRDWTQLMSELTLPAPTVALPGKYTYHDPCHLARGMDLREEPRRLLREGAGVDLVELTEADWCCGGAGSYNLTHPERSLAILERKMSHLRETGAHTVVTACPACIIQLRYGVKHTGLEVQVRHVAEVVAEAQGLALSPV
jgi:glycolate oxidase iron-sulfur subunit